MTGTAIAVSDGSYLGCRCQDDIWSSWCYPPPHIQPVPPWPPCQRETRLAPKATIHTLWPCGLGSQWWCPQGIPTASDTCPSCECMERAQHVPICPHPDHDVVWQEAINGLAAWFDLSHTNPEIRDCICSTQCLRSIDACFAPFTSPTITAAALYQDAIGWMNFIEGRISLEWHTAQSHFYASIGLSRTSHQWAEELVQNLLTKCGLLAMM